MSSIRVVHERRGVWLWVAGLAAVLLVLWIVVQTVEQTDYAVRNDSPRLLRSLPAAAARPAGEPAPAPDPATQEEEALRLRSRVMA